MKKHLAIASAVLSAVLAAGTLAGCGKTETKTVYDLPYYGGTEYSDVTGKPEYSSDLWRMNFVMPNLADPQVLNNTEQDGYFYSYGTSSVGDGFEYWRSRDLETWELCGQCISFNSIGLHGWGSIWAPEVIYDEDAEKYFLFFSATPPKENVGTSAFSAYFPLVAVSDKAGGPFKVVNFMDAASCGAENVHTYDTEIYPQESAKYYLFDIQLFNAAVKAEGERTGLTEDIYANDGHTLKTGEFIRNIDLHPFVDPATKKKYLLASATPNCIMGIEMETWLKPKYDTYKILTRAMYYTVKDYTDETLHGQSVEAVEYETYASQCNEGPFMIEHNGKYYLTFSIGDYRENAYSVLQAVADSPLGDFRKLTEAENGPMLSSDLGSNAMISGPGHHSFVRATVGGEEKLFITYHAHNDPENAGAGRHVQIDEVKWVTIKDINGDDLDVMYVNGPTATVQPTFGIGKEYAGRSFDQVALENGKLEEGSSADCLVDGLVAFNNEVCVDFNKIYARETVITSRSTFYASFEKAKTVRGFMIYNSKKYDESGKRGYFEKITNIELVCEENGAEVSCFIPELSFEYKQGLSYIDDGGTIFVSDVVRGAGAWAEFDAINLKGIRFTVEVPEQFKYVGLSEIVALVKQGA